MNIFIEVEKALKEKLSGITLPGKGGATIAVPILFTAPEAEFKEADYPALVISMYDIRPAQNRGYLEPFYKELAPGQLKKYNACQPYDIYYQIAGLSLFNSHDRGLHLGLMKKLRRLDFISIIEDGNPLNLTVRFEGYSEQDSIGAKRVFRKMWTYVVEASINDVEYETVRQVLEVDVQLEQKSGG